MQSAGASLVKPRRKLLWLAALVVGVLGLGGWGGWQYTQQSGSPSVQEIDRWRMQAMVGHEEHAMPALKRAAQSASSESRIAAQRALGEVLLRKPETALDGIRYAEQAANQGDAAAQLMLGKAYFDGTGTRTKVPDMVSARRWLEGAAEKKNAPAMYLLGLMDKAGYGGKVDAKQSVQWFAKAVQLEHPEAMFMLANAYANGEGVAKDEQQALRLYKAAAEHENPLAAQVLAMAYHEGGLGLQQDKKEAAQMMREVEHILSHPH